MRKSDIPAVVSSGLFEPSTEVRVFGWGRVIAGTSPGLRVLIVQERGSEHHTLYEYDDLEEFRADLRRVIRFPTSGGPGEAGLAVPTLPTAPTRITGACQPRPDEQHDA